MNLWFIARRGFQGGAAKIWSGWQSAFPCGNKRFIFLGRL